jgi:hypothetical protein
MNIIIATFLVLSSSGAFAETVTIGAALFTQDCTFGSNAASSVDMYVSSFDHLSKTFLNGEPVRAGDHVLTPILELAAPTR